MARNLGESGESKQHKPFLPALIAAVVIVGGLVWLASTSARSASWLKGQLSDTQKKASDLSRKVSDLETSLAGQQKEAAEAKQKAEEMSKIAEAAKLAALEVPSDWRSFEVQPLGFTFRYPKEWGDAAIKLFKLENKPGERGEGGTIVFAASRPTMLQAGWNSSDYTSSRPVPSYDVARSKGVKNCEELRQRAAVSSCEELKTMDDWLVLLYKETPPPEDPTGAVTFTFNVGVAMTGIERFPTFGIQVNQDSSINLETLRKVVGSIRKKESPTNANTTSTPPAAPPPAATPAPEPPKKP